MPFIYSVAAHVSDSKLFAEAGAGWAGERMRSLGANSVTANQVVMGGEMAGQVLVAFEVDTADSAMALNAAIYGDDDLVGLLRDAGVQVERRSLMRIQAEFGTRDASHATVLYVAGQPVDDETAETNFTRNWNHQRRCSGDDSDASRCVRTRTLQWSCRDLGRLHGCAARSVCRELCRPSGSGNDGGDEINDPGSFDDASPFLGVPSRADPPRVRDECPTCCQRARVSERSWSGRRDLNPRPPAPKAGALPSCATSRVVNGICCGTNYIPIVIRYYSSAVSTLPVASSSDTSRAKLSSDTRTFIALL